MKRISLSGIVFATGVAILFSSCSRGTSEDTSRTSQSNNEEFHTGSADESPDAAKLASTSPGAASVPVASDSPPAGVNVISASLRLPDDIPDAPMGRSLKPSAVANAPGYTPPNDDFAADVVRGRREVEPMDYVLKGGTASAEELAMFIVRAVNMKDVDALQALLITHKEFNELIWPEMPQGRPVTNIEADHAWGFQMRAASSGARRGVLDYEPQTPLTVESIDFTIGRASYTNFTLYRGARIHTRSKAGVPVPLDFAFTWIECNGRWKVYIYKD